MSDSKLSFYVLVKNSEQYLDAILSQITKVADEMIVLDSGSEDQTQTIAERWGAQWHFRSFDNFRSQRSHALSLCQNEHVLFLDADEIPDDALIETVRNQKQAGFAFDAYFIQREWFVLGKRVHSIYPVTSPDYPIRLINKSKVSHAESTQVHEYCFGHETQHTLAGKIIHQTFHTQAELQRKLTIYSTLAAQDLLERGKFCPFYKMILNPPLAWLKWYIMKQGWRDGLIGIFLANYAFRYTYLKYNKYKKNHKIRVC